MDRIQLFLNTYSILEMMNEDTLDESIRWRLRHNYFCSIGSKQRKGGRIKQHFHVERKRAF